MGRILRMGVMGTLGLLALGFALGLLAGTGELGTTGKRGIKVGRFRTARYRRPKAAS
ncbi:hypothetical protein GTO91_00840 [Heliobacterium undosum]|uniref:Uncharacterized protein n=1 Tax=Heliomicrobium undosum TaxID=121734 RepID=A0A845L069_9FIRM|nr:hypothetical protein [Heliomicrobium undosum]MZP28269.1 hypothetical protein [Heliomicrobium undosum]